MSYVSSQPQFRYTQPLSKVLHLRNLPWECTEEELIELGKPFGKVVNTKGNVGASRNQALIEFVRRLHFSITPLATWNNSYLSLAIKMASQAGAFWGGHDYGVLCWDNKLAGAQVPKFYV
ncbi:hypothetical protein DCAR_0625959 [Daucus carota subsp. sativus]|uniref:Uncharacterized protein n=1 Tax=Daucus carota subsp. sativus TaxID=79200 RepID=A0A164WSP9_DAUCS|nr:hypothetical protein DCAR_0625959 [Daucus carota subsp. sativus]